VSDFQDRTLTCADCGGAFTFTAGEQAFYQERGFSEPKRCTSCRSARKAGRQGTGQSYKSSERGSYGGGQRDRPPRQMYDVTCDDCGKATQVPFRPRDDRPVYCKDCYEERR
jgi:CxxC-x17-CxxC domain-containing protein